MNTMIYWVCGIAVMAIVTYLPRALPLSLMREKVKMPFMQSFLEYMPYAVLGAMTFPAVLESTSSPISAGIGALVALVMALCKCNLLPVALCATSAVFIIEWAMKIPF